MNKRLQSYSFHTFSLVTATQPVLTISSVISLQVSAPVSLESLKECVMFVSQDINLSRPSDVFRVTVTCLAVYLSFVPMMDSAHAK